MNCHLKNLVIPYNTQRISPEAFSYNYELEEITYGGNNSFNYEYEGEAIFSSLPSLRKVTFRGLFPTKWSGFYKEQVWSKVEVYVPAITLNDYLLSDGWTMFANIYPSDEDLTDITVDRPFTITADRGIADKANLTLNGMEASLTVRRSVNAPLNLGKFTFDCSSWSNLPYSGATLIPHSVVTAEEPIMNLSVNGDNWHFISLPFDVNVSEIETSEDALWVVRRYDGDARASLSENTWKNMADGDVLKAGQGYIFHCANNTNFTFRPAAGTDHNRMFTFDAVETELAQYPSEFAHNASWNLVGNPYPAYLGIRALDFEGPVTVWTGGTYRAYNPIDDEYALAPFQAFFVQRQDYEGGEAIRFLPEGRFHSQEEAKSFERQEAATQSVGAQQRALFNITLAGENGSDRTRVVFNPAASPAYETNRDAAKFMSTDAAAAQIYVMNNGVRMAIDERPLGNGEVVLGIRTGHEGEYSIALDSRRAEGYTAILTDTRTGLRTDITSAPYVFTASAGSDDARFILTFEAQITGIDAVATGSIAVRVDGNELSVSAPEAIEVTVVAVDGRTVAAGHGTAFTATLPQGIYVVKAGETTIKVAVGK